MLVLTRKLGEVVHVGPHFEVQVVGQEEGWARLGVIESGKPQWESEWLGLGDSLAFGPDLRVEVVLLRRFQVRLGFTAPSNVPVLRRELVTDPAQLLRPYTGRRGGNRDNTAA